MPSEVRVTTAQRLSILAAGALVGIFVVAPRSSPALVLPFALLPLAWIDGRAAIARARPRMPALALAATTIGYLLVNASWSAAGADAYGKIALLVALLAALCIGRAAWERLDDAPVRAMARAMALGLIVTVLFLLIEEWTQHAIKRGIFNCLPFLRPDAKHIKVAVDIVEQVGDYISNRSMAVVALMIWPLLLMTHLGLLVDGRRRLAAGCALFALAAVTIAISKHETSMVALAAAALTFAAARLWPRPMIALVAAGWLAACLLVVPVMKLAFDRGLHFTAELPHTARQRVILWGYTAGLVPNAAWLGVGVEATKPLDNARGKEVPTPAGYVYQLRTGPHAHNIFLQTWYELGAVGALLLAASGLAVIVAIAGVPVTALPYALAGFVSAAGIGSFSWGLWQPWFLAAFAITALLTVIAVSQARRRAASGAARQAPTFAPRPRTRLGIGDTSGGTLDADVASTR